MYWFDGAGGSAAAAAARSLNVRRLIPLSQLGEWLDGALPVLARIARARREQMDAELALPPMPTGDAGDLRIPLLEAERRFREAYLRRVLSESKNHAVAARKAGLAYTTFCSMLRKLDVRV